MLQLKINYVNKMIHVCSPAFSAYLSAYSTVPISKHHSCQIAKSVVCLSALKIGLGMGWDLIPINTMATLIN